VGSTVQDKLESTGITSGVTYYAGQAVEGTKNVGSAIMETGTAAVVSATGMATGNPYVSDFT